jgi:cytochrome P450
MANSTEKPDGRKNCTTGKLGDPAWRHERAMKGAAARNSIERLVENIVARAPELNQEHRQQLALMLIAAIPDGGNSDAP